mgnify:CR=1 FL=1
MAEKTDQVLASRIPVDEPSPFSELGLCGAGLAAGGAAKMVMSPAEFEKGLKLAQRLADLKEHARIILENPSLLQEPRWRQRARNVNLFIKEGKESLNRLMSIANENERDLLRQATKGAKMSAQAKPLKLPEVTPRASARSGLRNVGRAVSRVANPAIMAYEGARLGHNIYEHGPLEGTLEAGGNVISEIGSIPKWLGGFFPDDSLTGRGLTGLGNLMGEADYWGPEDAREDPATREFMRRYSENRRGR